ncbi:uncharacterized protein DS421_19g644340 [Arachis hypogaea]|uniref:Uncharacterized protein n=1 Tax=Arachis hypogaea TaxID=3818 RepID=A0A6B9V4W3_ARAHY|nr:uncharacterized protein DS421_19g644340 [Arachis hypogaea]
MSTGRGVADQAAGRGRSHGRGRRRVTSSIPKTSGSSPSTLTTPVTPQLASMSMPPPATDATALESGHVSEAAANPPPPPPIVRLKIWHDSNTGCTLGGTLRMTLPSERYSTIEWSSRCWIMFVRGGNTGQPGSD